MNGRLSVLVFLVGLGLAGPAHTADACSELPSPLQVKEGGTILSPKGYDQATFIETANNKAITQSVRAKGVALDDKNVIAKLKKTPSGISLRWFTNDGSKSCLRPLVLASGGDTSGGATDEGATAGGAEDCWTAANAYREKIVGKRRRASLSTTFTLVTFCGGDTAFQTTWPEGGSPVVGDPLYVAAYVSPDYTNVKAEFTECASRDAGPVRFGSTPFGTFGVLDTEGAYRMVPPEPVNYRQCFNKSVPVKITAKGAGDLGDIETTYTVQQYERYTFTTQLGVAFTDAVEHTFAVTDDGTGTTRIRDTGPAGPGPQYFAALVIYGMPWHLCNLVPKCQREPGERAYLGRELVYEDDILDRIGGVIGVGLKNPEDEFIAGLSFELSPGLNVMGLYRLARISELDGVAVGDAFTGPTDTLPRKTVWDDGFVWAVSLDLRYASALFDRK